MKRFHKTNTFYVISQEDPRLHSKIFGFADTPSLPFSSQEGAALPMLSPCPHRRRGVAGTPGLGSPELWLRLTPGETKSYKEEGFESSR